MVQVQRTFVVEVPQHVVVGYLRDFSHTEAWDPGTVICDQVGDDAISVGTVWHNTSRFLGLSTELDYELRRDDPDHLTFVGRNKTATSTDDMRFATSGTGTQITYRATIEFRGPARLAGPLVQVAFQRIASKTVTQMRETLQALPAR